MNLQDRIKEIAIKHCAEYPEITTVKPWEQLHAIELSLKGLSDACEDWMKVLKALQKKFGFINDELTELMKENKIFPYNNG